MILELMHFSTFIWLLYHVFVAVIAASNLGAISLPIPVLTMWSHELNHVQIQKTFCFIMLQITLCHSQGHCPFSMDVFSKVSWSHFDARNRFFSPLHTLSKCILSTFPATLKRSPKMLISHFCSYPVFIFRLARLLSQSE